MKRDFSQILKDYHGKDIVVEGTNLTLGDTCIRALNTIFEDERSLAGDDKFKRSLLCHKIVNGGDVEVTAEEISSMKLVVGKLFNPLVVGEVYRIFESDTKDGE